MSNPHSDPVYGPARHQVDLLIEALDLPQSRADNLRLKHEIDMRTDPATGAMVYESGAADTAEWLRGIEKSYPHLVSKAPAPATPTPTPATWSDKTLTEVFAGSARGEAGASTELDRRANPIARAPTNAAPNLTQAMARAHAGDPAAQAAVDRFFL